jgi:hypothetical protein
MISLMVCPPYHRFPLERTLDGPGAGLYVVAKKGIGALGGNRTHFISQTRTSDRDVRDDGIMLLLRNQIWTEYEQTCKTLNAEYMWPSVTDWSP